MRRIRRIKKALGKLLKRPLCQVGLHKWGPWDQGDAFRYHECTRPGCGANELKGSQW